MGMTATQIQLKNYDDLRGMPDDGKRYELIHGEIVLSPSPTAKHQRVLGRLFNRMSALVDANAQGEAFVAPFDVKFSPYNVVQPDILFISKGSRNALAENSLNGSPPLVVEILSPSNRMQDLVQKAAIYAPNEVLEYWVADPETETIMVYELKEGQYVPIEAKSGFAKSIVLSGFDVRLRDVFSEPEWMKTDEPSAK